MTASDDGNPILRITPAPTDAELAAIAAAIAVLRGPRAAGEAPKPSRWRRAGRMDAVGLAGDGRDAWRQIAQPAWERSGRGAR